MEARSTPAVLAVISTTCAVLIAAGSAPATAKDTRLVLNQVHRIYGPLEVVITGEGVKAASSATDYAFMCKAPDWDALIYSDKRKIVSRRPFSVWSKSGIKTAINLMDNQVLFKWPRTLVAKRKYKGIDAELYAFPYRYENGRPADLKHGKFGDYVISSGLPAHKNVQRFLQSLYDVPPAEGLPLKFQKYAQGNSFGLGLKYNQVEDVVAILDTTGMKRDSQPVSFSDSRFKAYKSVTESDIVVKHDEFTNMFETFMTEDGGRKKPGSEKKKP